jgi:hypothetical protein
MLVGSASPRVLAANDMGAIALEMQVQGISLVLSRKPRQQTRFQVVGRESLMTLELGIHGFNL